MTALNIPLPSDRNGRARWPWIAAAAWLLLVSVLAIINSVGLARIAEQTRTSTQDARVQALVTRVADLEQTATRQPKPVGQADLDTARQSIEERMARIEQSQAAEDHSSQVQALQARIGAMEYQLKKAAPPAAAAPRRITESPKPKTPEPPFQVIGLELRGGERFLCVAMPGAATVRDLQLLREGDTVGAWHLQSIDVHAAVFRVDGQTLRVAVP